MAIDVTVKHGWQKRNQEARTAPGREKWRTFLVDAEAGKHERYDTICRRADWSFRAMGFGFWGGLGPECAATLHQIVDRAAGWVQGKLRPLSAARLCVG